MVQDIKKELTKKISGWLQALGVADPVVQLDKSVVSEFGEFATNVAMRYAKDLSRNPLVIANELGQFLVEQDIEGLEKAEAVKPGFLNLYLTSKAKIAHMRGVLEYGSAFGHNHSHQGERWVIEHTSPNPNKAMHLGHLRNNLLGMGIVRLLKASGAEVVADAVYNNRGIAIAKVMYGFLAHMKKGTQPTDIFYWTKHKDEWYLPKEKGLKPDVFVTECYVLAEKDAKENAEIDKLIRQMVIDWESQNEAVWELWDCVLQIAYSGINRTLERLGSHWDKVWYEHEHYQKGKQYVEKGLDKGIFKRLEDGAVLTDLEENYGITDTVLLKNDGTSLYITQDIALTDLKRKTYNADKLIWVIGPDQSLAMKQLFAVSEQLGIGRVEDFAHVPYGYVGLKDEAGGFKKMSSREGTALFIDDLIDEVKGMVLDRYEKEDRHTTENREVIAEQLALAAVKFAFLKSDRMQGITFDVEQSVDVQGDSGMYVMYTYVRTQSILRKAGEAKGEFVAPGELGSEAKLVRTLLYFEDIIEKSVGDLSVHHVAQYLLELCSEFNSWYAKETILDGTGHEAYKLSLVEAVGVTIQNGLALLGIETVDEM